MTVSILCDGLFRGNKLPFDWDRNRDLTFTIKAVIHRVFKVVLPALSILSILSGYYLIWNISPDSLLTEVIVKTKTGIFLTLFGGIMLVIGLRRILK
jgi:cell division septal protein FtsQ